MEHELISYETAVLAKEKGFDIAVNNYWTDTFNAKNERIFDNGDGDCEFIRINHNMFEGLYSRPTKVMLQTWLRDVKRASVDVVTNAVQSSSSNRACKQFTYIVAISTLTRVRSLDYFDSFYITHPVNSFPHLTNFEEHPQALEAGLIQALKTIQ